MEQNPRPSILPARKEKIPEHSLWIAWLNSNLTYVETFEEYMDKNWDMQGKNMLKGNDKR
jgi:hypothetical protein